MMLVQLPPVLILHLKRFLFDTTGSHKISKHVSYDMLLEIPKGERKGEGEEREGGRNGWKKGREEG